MKKLWFLLIFLLCLCVQGNSFAYDDILTHPAITKVAIEQSNLRDFLINNLGISEGIEKTYDGKMIMKLLQLGSTNEDLAFRAFNHFWNPIHNEGLDDEGWGWVFGWIPIWYHFTGLPNIDWAMGEAQDGTRLDDCGEGDHSKDHNCNDYSWKRAREAYYEAIVGLTEDARNDSFMELYEKLGRVLHLLQDTGVPAHTRNDMFGHLDFTRFEGVNPIGWGGNLYEFWVKVQLEKDKEFVSGIASNIIKPIFISPKHYWDREVYSGADPNVTLPVSGEEQSGLAEYCNANFLSKCAMFNEDLPFGDRHYFPYPKKPVWK